MERLVHTFTAIDQFGVSYVVHVLQGYHEVEGERGQTKMKEDKLFELRTADGRFVQPRGSGFEIIDGAERILLTTNDPDAPQRG